MPVTVIPLTGGCKGNKGPLLPARGPRQPPISEAAGADAGCTPAVHASIVRRGPLCFTPHQVLPLNHRVLMVAAGSLPLATM